MPDSQPKRTCVGCRSCRSQSELTRLYLDEDGRIQLGRSGPGRGAWICLDQSEHCLAAAIERKTFARAFRRAPDRGSVSSLQERWSNSSDNKH